MEVRQTCGAASSTTEQLEVHQKNGSNLHSCLGTKFSLNHKVEGSFTKTDLTDSETEETSRNSSSSEISKNMLTLLIIVLNIALPTVDVYSDLYMVVKFIRSGHPRYGELLLVPFLLNYLFSWAAWYSLDKRKQLTWMAAFISCYPQYCAARVVFLLWWGDARKAVEEKRRYEREVSEIEVFTEAVLSTLVSSYLMQKALLDKCSSTTGTESGQSSCGLSSRVGGDEQNLITGAKYSLDYYMFFVAFSTSIMSASLGMAKVLKVGPCRILGEGGPLGGLGAPRFLLLLVTMGVTLGGKGFILAIVFSSLKPLMVKVALTLNSVFLPGLVLALLCLCHYRGSVRNILGHPSLLLLPIFSHFTFSVNSFCWGKRFKPHVRVMFSRRATMANIGLSALGLLGYIETVASDETQGYNKGLLIFSTCLMPVLGMLLTLLFLFLDWCPCTSSPPLQYCALQIDDPFTELIVNRS